MEDFKELNFLIEKYLISGCQWINIVRIRQNAQY